MNVLFFLVFCLSALYFLCTDPNALLAVMLDGASSSATLCVSLLATYAVWLGLIRLWEDSGVSRRVAKLVKPLAKRLLKTDDEETLSAVSMNLSVNLLGISGAGTPYGVKSARLLDKTQNAEFSSAMFFILNATSLQLIPASIVAVRTSLQSVAPYDIILPTLLTTCFSTLLGVTLTWAFLRPKKTSKTDPFFLKTAKTKGAGTSL